jgi:hypothetical protein
MPTVATIANSDMTTRLPNVAKRKRSEEANDDDVASKPDPVELQRLLLPSEIPIQVLDGCHHGLGDIER